MNKEEKEKFGAIIEDYETREKLKMLATLTGVEHFRILANWSRSVEANNFDLRSKLS